MNIKLSKKQARLALACILEIQQTNYWYNESASEVVTKSNEGNLAISELVWALNDQGVDDDDDSIYRKLLVKMIASVQ